VPFDRLAVPFDRLAVPFDRLAVPFDRLAVPFDRLAVPFDREAGWEIEALPAWLATTAFLVALRLLIRDFF